MPAIRSTGLLLAGMASFSLTACSGLFQDDSEQASRAPAGAAQASGQQRQEVAVATSEQLVRKVQQQLRAEGVDAGPVDGIWGPRTEQGLRQFQQAEGLEATGKLDMRTLSALGVGTQAASAASEESASAGSGSAARPETGGAQAAAARAGMAAQGERQTAQMEREDLGQQSGAQPARGEPSFSNLDANDDGMVTLAEAAADTRISRNFERADRDNDHRLDKQEFQAAMEVDRQGAQSPFAAADRDGDGALNREEYQEALRTRQAAGAQSASAGASPPAAEQRTVAVFQRADTDSDGMLSREEFRAAVQMRQARRAQEGRSAASGASVERAAESAFGQADRDNDGKLSREEFQEAADRHRARRSGKSGD